MIVVNLDEGHQLVVLTFNVQLDIDTHAMYEEIDQKLGRIRHAMILVASHRNVEDVANYKGKTKLVEDIRKELNRILTKGVLSECS